MKITKQQIKKLIKEELSLIKEGYDEFGRKQYSGKNDSFAVNRYEEESYEAPQWDDYFDNERESGDGNEEDAMNALENALDSGDIEKAKKATERLKQLRGL